MRATSLTTFFLPSISISVNRTPAHLSVEQEFYLLVVLEGLCHFFFGSRVKLEVTVPSSGWPGMSETFSTTLK